MFRKKDSASFPDRKISETFLDFAAPLLEVTGGRASKDQIGKILMIAFTVWNAVVLDAVNGDAQYVTKIRQSTADDTDLEALIEQMISRKKAEFGHDLRMIGEYKIVKWKKGEWRIRVEARDPTTRHRDDRESEKF